MMAMRVPSVFCLTANIRYDSTFLGTWQLHLYMVFLPIAVAERGS